MSREVHNDFVIKDKRMRKAVAYAYEIYYGTQEENTLPSTYIPTEEAKKFVKDREALFN